MRQLLKACRRVGRGFTLVELLVTIVVLGIVISQYLSGLYYLMQITQVQGQHYDLAVRAARTQMEICGTMRYGSSNPGGTINFTSSLPSALPPNKSGTVTISQPLPELRRVDVMITYTDYGKSQTIELSSDIGIIGLGQGQ